MKLEKNGKSGVTCSLSSWAWRSACPVALLISAKAGDPVESFTRVLIAASWIHNWNTPTTPKQKFHRNNILRILHLPKQRSLTETISSKSRIFPTKSWTENILRITHLPKQKFHTKILRKSHIFPSRSSPENILKNSWIFPSKSPTRTSSENPASLQAKKFHRNNIFRIPHLPEQKKFHRNNIIRIPYLCKQNFPSLKNILRILHTSSPTRKFHRKCISSESCNLSKQESSSESHIHLCKQESSTETIRIPGISLCQLLHVQSIIIIIIIISKPSP